MTVSNTTNNNQVPSEILVSVIIRTQNRQNTLKKAIESVVNQDYKPIQLIIINDAGEDIEALALSFQASFYQLDHHLISTSKGRSHAANVGLDKCQGDLISFLDDDDWFLPEHIKGLVQAYNQSEHCQLVYSGIASSVVDANNHPIHIFNDPFDHIRLLIENYIPIHAALFSRNLIEQGCRFDETFSIYEDWDFWLQLAEKSCFHHYDKISAIYHLDENSGVGQKSDTILNLANAKKKILAKWRKRWTIEQLDAIIARSLEFPCLSVLRNENAEVKISLTESQKEQTIEKLKSCKISLQFGQLKAVLSSLELKLRTFEPKLRLEKLNLETKITQILTTKIDLEKQSYEIFNSRSWKLTKPYRALGQIAIRVKNFISFCRIHGFAAGINMLKNKLSAPTPTKSNDKQTTLNQAETYHPLHFRKTEKPLVSIIIPVFNNINYTFKCLKSILLHLQATSYEVIIVDDCSTDNTHEILQQVSGIIITRNEENSGFIASCNHGAKKAQGKYVLFLNNDTKVTENWLDELVQTYTNFTNVGMVGAKLLYPDGRLQEAGSIVWQDGSAWNYGRLSDPKLPQFCYAREVDYCSGACIIIEKTFFDSLGCFDSIYFPAYYEDTDLAFKIREAGKKVIYQANAQVIHFEGVSSGTDTNSGVKQYQVINHEIFLTRWKTTLQAHRANGIEPELEKERAITKRVLILDARMLTYDQDSGSLRMYNLLDILQKENFKVIFCPLDLEPCPEYAKPMQAKGIETIYKPFYPSIEDYLKSCGGIFDLVIISRVLVAHKTFDQVIKYCKNAKIIYDTVDLHFLRELRETDCNPSSIEQTKLVTQLKTSEVGFMHQADATWVVSDYEKRLLNQEYPKLPIHIVSNIHDLKKQGTDKNFNQRKDFMFIGGFEHKPNVDAMLYFCQNILPKVFAKLPQLTFHIVGSKPTQEILDLASAQIIVHGFVKDINPLFEKIRLTVAPLRYGAGVKGKINTSMSYAVPVVATLVAAEGMYLEGGLNVLIAEEDQDFADAIIKLHENEELWNTLSSNSLQNIEQHFSFDAVQINIKESLADLGI